MTNRSATAKWQGSLQEGGGTVALGTGAIEAPISFSSRFEEGEGTNPDQLLAGALAGCFTMAFSYVLSEAGTPPDSLETNADVTLRQSDDGLAITRIEVDGARAGPRDRPGPVRRARERRQVRVRGVEGAGRGRGDHARRHARELTG